MTGLTSMQSCATELKDGQIQHKGCSKGAEVQICDQVRADLDVVASDLKSLATLYTAMSSSPVSLLEIPPQSVNREHLAAICSKLKQQVPLCDVSGGPGPEPETPDVTLVMLIVQLALLAVLLVLSLMMVGMLGGGHGGQAHMDDGHYLEVGREKTEGGGDGPRPCKSRSIVVMIVALMVITIWSLWQHRGPASHSPPPPLTQCLAREHNIQHTFDMCEGVRGVLEGGFFGGESAEVTLERVVSKLAKEFPELAGVMLGS